MEKRNRFFSFLKGKKQPSDTASDKGVLLGFGGDTSTSFDDYAKEANSTYEACVDCLAKHMSKIKPVAYYKDEEMERASGLNRILNLRPNQLQTASQFYYTMADSYFRYGMAIAHIVYDSSYNLKALVPIDQSVMEVRQTRSGDYVYLDFMEKDGTHTRDLYENFVILIRKSNASNPFLSKDISIKKIIGALNANTDSFAKALTESHIIRYVAKMATVSADEKQKQIRADFQKQLESDANGLLIIPGVLDFTQINSSQGVYAKQPELDDFKSEIYSYFGLTPDFVKGRFTENEFQSFYENTLEPVINDLKQELTWKLFTLREIGHGDEIRIETSPLQTASLATRIQLAQAIMSCGMYKPNDVMRLLYQAPIEGGDKVVQSLNYVDSEKANQYQTGDDDKKEENEDKEETSEEEDTKKGDQENGD